MLTKFKKYLYSSAAAITLAVSLLAPVGMASSLTAIQQSVCDGTNAAAGPGGGGDCSASGDTDALSNIARKIVSIFSYIVGIISVIFIIFGGFRYITSGGDSNNVSTAKNTLIYALIGLVIVALAQFIVNYVFSTASGATSEG